MADPLTGPIDQHASSQAKNLFDVLPALGAGEMIKRIPLHWSAEAYGCTDAAYNVVIALVNHLWIARMVVSPRLNATRPVHAGYAAATRNRNSYSCSIAANGMVGATPANFAGAPVQLHELEVLCAAAAAVAQKYAIDTHAEYENVPAIATHAEFAIADGYYLTDKPSDGVVRWDLAEIVPNQYGGPPSAANARATGDHLRERIRAYKTTVVW